MELQRKIRAVAGKAVGASSGGKPPAEADLSTHNQGLASLIVMIAVLTIIIMFCCLSAPGIRDLCKRYVFRTCTMDDPDQDNVYTRRNTEKKASAAGDATPTIILLPYGRMLVVDRSVFAQLQADHTGIDFMELSANLIRAQRLRTGLSTPSILDSDTTSKGLSPTSLGFSPPSYEDIFGDTTTTTTKSDLPPSYSEVSLLFRLHGRRCINEETIEMCTMMDERDSSVVLVDGSDAIMVDNENNCNQELQDRVGRDDNVAITIEAIDGLSLAVNESSL